MSSLTVLAAAIVIVAAIPAAAAERLSLAGRTVVLAAPDGYCVLNGRQPNEAIVIERLRKANAGRNELLLAYADCGEIDHLRAGMIGQLSRHGHILAGMADGKVRPLPSPDRGRLLDEVARQVPAFDRKGLSDAVNKALARAGMGRLSELRQGVAARDDTALYLANVGVMTVDGKRQTVAGVTAITVIDGLLVSTNLYRPFENNRTIDALVADQKAATAALLAANEPRGTATTAPQATEGQPAPAAAPNGDTGESRAAAIAVLLALALLAGYYFRRSRR